MPDILDQLAKILNQAEHAGTQEEADTYFARALKLSSRYSIDLATARHHTAKIQKREEPTMETIELGTAGAHNNAEFCNLFMSIGRCYDIRFNIAHNSTYVVAFGMPSDIELAKALYASISQQMMQAAVEFIRSGKHKEELVTKWDRKHERWVRKPVDSRVAKREFYDSFRSRIGRRLRAAQAEAQQEATQAQDEVIAESGEGTSTALVVADKREEIEEFYNGKSNARGSWRGGARKGYSTSNSGRTAGDAAGRNARLGGEKALPGGPKALR